MPDASNTSCWIPTVTRTESWYRTVGCSRFPSPVRATSSSTSRVRGTTRKTARSLGSSTSSASSTRLTSTPMVQPRYTQIWAFDRDGEKMAFEELIDFITLRRDVNPGLHVYHYNHYEPTSIDHLTALHETREEAVGPPDGPVRNP